MRGKAGFVYASVLTACLLTLAAWPGVSSGAPGKTAFVSLLGERFTAVELGALRVNREITRVRFSWSPDEAIEGVIADALPTRDRHTGAGRKRAYWKRVYDAGGFFNVRGFDPARIAGGLRRLAKRGASRLLLVLKGRCLDTLHDSDHHFEAYGAYRNTFPAVSDYLYACYRIVVLNTRNAQVEYAGQTLDSVKISNSRWPENWAKVQRRERRWLRDYTTEMFRTGLPAQLVKAGVATPEAARLKPRAALQKKLRQGGDEYADAVYEVYRTTGIQKRFEARARRALFSRMRVAREQRVLYGDVVRDWTALYFNWRTLRKPLTFMYRRLDIGVEELKDIAGQAGARDGVWTPAREERAGLRRIWDKLINDDALDELFRRAVERRRLILEGAR